MFSRAHRSNDAPAGAARLALVALATEMALALCSCSSGPKSSGATAGGLIPCCSCDLASDSLAGPCGFGGKIPADGPITEKACTEACDRVFTALCPETPGSYLTRSIIKADLCSCSAGSAEPLTCGADLFCEPLSGACRPDCSHETRSCTAPFVCQSPDGGTSTCSDPRPAPACRGTPSGQQVPFASSPQGPPLHWTVGDGCVKVTHDPGLTFEVETFTAALDAWRALPCSRLCLEGPAASSTPPDLLLRERGIHLRVNPEPSISTGPALTSVSFAQASGRILAVVIDLSPDAAVRSGLTVDEYLYWLGQALGLGAAPASVSSVMAHNGTVVPNENRFQAPTAADEAALCRLYGDPPYCGE
jgi:hypothetical protein